MDLRLSFRERAYLDYKKKRKPEEFRGSWQQVIRHIIDNDMIKDEKLPDHPFKFNFQKAVESSSSNHDDSDDGTNV